MENTPYYGTNPRTGFSLGPSRHDVISRETYRDMCMSQYLTDVLYLEDLLSRKLSEHERILLLSQYGGEIESIIDLKERESIEKLLWTIRERYRLLLS